MNLSLLSAEIARRIPELAKDSVTNNEGVILRLMQEERERCESASIRIDVDRLCRASFERCVKAITEDINAKREAESVRKIPVNFIQCKSGGYCHSKDCLRHGCQWD